MPIAAQRFKFLDKETNVPTIDFSALTDNQVYNDVSSAVESALESFKGGDSLLSTLQDSLGSLKDMIMSAGGKLLSTLKDVLSSVIDTIGNLELPGIVKDIFNSVKSMDLGGVKSFLGDLLHVGSSFLCNNLDFLKLFMLGYALNKNILSGLLIALLLSWLDRYCKGFKAQEMKKASPTRQMEMMFPPTGTQVNSNNAFSTFSNMYGSFLKASAPVQITPAISTTSFLSQILNGNVSGSVNSLRASEISYNDRRNYMSVLDNSLGSYQPNSVEYRNILNARGQLTNLPLVSADRRDKNIRYSNLSDQFGTLAKNITGIDLNSMNIFSMTPDEKSMHSKMVEFKNNAANNPDVMTRTNNSGSFKNFNFNNILPQLSDGDTNYLSTLKTDTNPHRLHDLHPTSEIFLKAAMNV